MSCPSSAYQYLSRELLKQLFNPDLVVVSERAPSPAQLPIDYHGGLDTKDRQIRCKKYLINDDEVANRALS